MTIHSTNSRYGYVAVSIHWLSALLIIALLGSGFRAADTLDPVVKAGILRFHAPLGIAIGFLTVMRLVWWLIIDNNPSAIGEDPKWQKRIAKTVHVFFYVLIFGMTMSGVGMFALSGAASPVFEGTGRLPDFNLYPPRVPHGIGAVVMTALLVVHAGAALYHHFIKRDDTLRRMWFGKIKATM